MLFILRGYRFVKRIVLFLGFFLMIYTILGEMVEYLVLELKRIRARRFIVVLPESQAIHIQRAEME